MTAAPGFQSSSVTVTSQRPAAATAPSWSWGHSPQPAPDLQSRSHPAPPNFHSRGPIPDLRSRTLFAPPLWPHHIPLHWRRPWHHHHRPGFVFYGTPFLGVPYYETATVVVTEVAPGVIRADRLNVEQSPAETTAGRGADTVAPLDPTPQEIVARLLTLAAVNKNDVIYDLGSGDGRILIAAAKRYGARGVGFEIDPGLVKQARANAKREGVEKLVEFRQRDFLGADLSPATLVTLYLSQEGNLAVREQLTRQLKVGARIVSYAFDMGDWAPKIAETYRDAAGNSHLLYLWEVAAPTLASGRPEMLQPHPARGGPLIIEVR
jgi:SAM-dependent methyltransferase